MKGTNSIYKGMKVKQHPRILHIEGYLLNQFLEIWNMNMEKKAKNSWNAIWVFIGKWFPEVNELGTRWELDFSPLFRVDIHEVLHNDAMEKR